MDLKKACQGDNLEVLESHIILLSAFIKFKNKKNKVGNLKLFKKKSESKKMSIVEVGKLLKLVQAHGNFANLELQKIFKKIIIPLYKFIVL